MSQHPERYRQDLNPDPQAGQNRGPTGGDQGGGGRTAHDYKDVHGILDDWNDADLKQLVILPEGTRLQQGATYYDLTSPDVGEFTARGDMLAGPGSRIVPKDQVDYSLWNRLTEGRSRK